MLSIFYNYSCKTLNYKTINGFYFAREDKYNKTVIIFLNQLIMLSNTTICIQKHTFVYMIMCFASNLNGGIYYVKLQ